MINCLYFVSNVIIVKIRARYAKRLTKTDYDNLVACKKVSEVASYLKNKQAYRESLLNVDDKNVRRSFLESVLNQNFFEDLAVLAKYDLTFGRKIFRYILKKFEIRQINRFLIFLKSGDISKFECSFPKFLKSKSKIKFDSFNKAQNYNDLLNFVYKTEYYDILKSNINKNLDFDINKIETELYNNIFSMFFDVINKLNSKIREKIKKFLYSCVDVSNAIRITRARKFYNSDDNFISDIIFNFGDYKFSKYDFLKNSNFSNFSLFGDNINSVQELEKFSKIMRFNWSRKNIRYSNISEVVGFSYVFLKEIEISNVINIIEGVRYGISKEKIRQLLIL